MSTPAHHSRSTLILNLGAVAAILVALVGRGGQWSTSYSLLVGVGVLTLVLSVLAFLGRDPLTNFAAGPVLARSWIRFVLAIGPWLTLLAIVVVRDLWWTQQDWRARLVASYIALVWSALWIARPVAWPKLAAADGRAVRGFLSATAFVSLVLAVNGLAFGTLPFGVQVSAGIGLVAATIAFAARHARTATCERLVTATIGVVFGLVMVEVAVRVLHIGESFLEVDSPEYVRQYHHISPPGTSYVNQPKPLDEFAPAVVEINSFGIRGPEIAPGPVDLLLIGDSMIEARQLPWDQVLSAKLPAALAARSSKARAVGHGVRGWSPLLEWNWYLKSGRKLHPRNVLLFFFWNDLWVAGDEVRTFRAVVGPDGRPQYFDQAVDPAWVWYKHVRIVRLAGDILQRVEFGAVRRAISMAGSRGDMSSASAEETATRMAASQDGLLSAAEVDQLLSTPTDQLSPRLQRVARAEFWPSVRPMALWSDEQREAVGKTEVELRRFADDVAADGGRLVIIYVPNALQISSNECRVARRLAGFQDDRLLPESSGIQDWIRGVAERQKIELVDPSDTMRKFLSSRPAGSPQLYLRADCHWSEAGHQFMADFLADWYVRTREGR